MILKLPNTILRQIRSSTTLATSLSLHLTDVVEALAYPYLYYVLNRRSQTTSNAGRGKKSRAAPDICGYSP
jgi:hypothetical protein